VPPRDGQTAEIPALSLEIEGGIPGLTHDELRARLLPEMAAGGLKVTGPEVKYQIGQAKNLILWTFRPRPSAAGTVRYLGPGRDGAIVPPILSRPIAIDAHLVIAGLQVDAAKATVSITGCGSADAAWSPAVSGIVRKFVRDIQTKPGRHVADDALLRDEVVVP
jgi:hypothetical protein